MLPRVRKLFLIFDLHIDVLIGNFLVVKAFSKVIEANLKDNIINFMRIGNFWRESDGLLYSISRLLPDFSPGLQQWSVNIVTIGISDKDNPFFSVLVSITE